MWNPESTAWNPESKTLLDYLTWGDESIDSYDTGSMKLNLLSLEHGRLLADATFCTQWHHKIASP